jgi:NhaP-type Na+/H+ or K+/H+ antiporter
MNILTIIIALGLLIFFSHAFNELFSKTRIPNVLLLLLIGILVGPVGGLVSNDFFGELGKVFTQITLIVILFESGANLKLKDLKESVGHAALLTIFNFVATLGITILVAHYLVGLDMLSSFFVGAIIGGTSSAVVIPMVKQLKFGQRSSSVLILESALSDVLCLVVGLALLEGMVKGEVSVGVVFSEIWKDFLFAMLMGLVGGFIWSLLIQLIRSIKNSMMTTLAFVFVLYGIVELLKLNGGIAVLSFGILLSNVEMMNKNNLFQRLFKFETSGFTDNERDFFAEIVFVMQTYFFVYVGISIQFGSPWAYAAGLLIVLLIILFRAPAMRLFIGKSVPKPERSVMSVMSPKGMVPAVLASIPLQLGLYKADRIMDLGYSVVLFSIVVTSALVIILGFNPNFFEERIQKLAKKKSHHNDEEAEPSSEQTDVKTDS